MSSLLSLERDGFCLLPGAFTPAECDRLIAQWESVVSCRPEAAVLRTAEGHVYGARNLIDLWPDVTQVMHRPALATAIATALGSGYGLVRVLFFDKPPGASWALPWHKDLAIAVRDGNLSSGHFTRPTRKYGLPHVEAPGWLLERMLTARVHLDAVTDENGPLRVLTGSHRSGKVMGVSDAPPTSVLTGRGDVLLMRPLLAHASAHSAPGTARHRRILHLEFSGVAELPDGFAWHDFITG